MEGSTESKVKTKYDGESWEAAFVVNGANSFPGIPLFNSTFFIPPEAVEFVETDEVVGFEDTGTVYASEFIEDSNLTFGNLNFHFGEIIER